MNFHDDEPSIKQAIMRRLDDTGKTEVADIKVLLYDPAAILKAEPLFPTDKLDIPHIQVGVWCILKDRITFDGLVDTRSFFDLPPIFEHSHLINEIDEIAEQIKKVRAQTRASHAVFVKGRPQPRQAVIGTGLRGRWPEKAPDRA